MDRDLILSIIDVESSGNPRARGAAGEYGLMQIMPNNWAHYGSGDDPYDPIENVKAGTRILQENLNKYNGDLVYALAAYNAGSGNVDKALNNTGTIPNPEYVQKVLAKYDELKARKQQQNAARYALEDSDTTYLDWGTPNEFKESVGEAISTIGFTSMSPEEQIAAFDELYNSRSWQQEVNPIYKDIMTSVRSRLSEDSRIEAAIPIASDYLALIEGGTKEEINNSATQALTKLRQDLRRQGIAPEWYGEDLDLIFNRKVSQEIKAREGFFSTAWRGGKEFVQGTLDPVREAAAGLVDIAFGDDEAADNIRSWATEFLDSNGNLDFYYEVDEFGRIKYDDNEDPIEKIGGTLLRAAGSIVGTIGTFKAVAGVAAATGVSAAASYAAGALGIGGVNLLNNAGQAYELAQQNGATDEEAMTAAMFGGGVSLVNTTADLMISMAPQLSWMRVLNASNKAKAVAKYGSMGAGLGAVSNLAEQYGVEKGAEIATEGVYEVSPRNLTVAATGGAFGGGLIGSTQGLSHIPQQVVTQQPSSNIAPRLALPMPERYRESGSADPIRMPPVVPPEIVDRLAVRLQEFTTSNIDSTIIEFPDIRAVPSQLLDTLDLTATQINENQIQVLRKQPFIPPVEQDLIAVTRGLDAAAPQLARMPDPNRAEELIARRSNIDTELQAIDSTYNQPIKQRAQQLLSREQQLKNKLARLEGTRNNRRRPYSEQRARAVQTDIDNTRTELDNLRNESLLAPVEELQGIESSNVPLEEISLAASERSIIIDLVREARELDNQIAEITAPGYENKYHNAKKLVAELTSRKLNLQYDQAEGALQPQLYDTALRINTETPAGGSKIRYAINEDNEWFILEPDGRAITDGDRFLSEAINKLRQIDELPSEPITYSNTPRVERVPKSSSDATKTDTKAVIQEDPIISKKSVADIEESVTELYSGARDIPTREGVLASDVDNITVAAPGAFDERITRSVPQKEYNKANYTTVPLTKPDTGISADTVFKRLIESASQIADDLSLAVGGTLRGAEGIYNLRYKWGRIRDRNDIPGAVHELAHALADFTVMPYLTLTNKGEIDITTIPKYAQDALADQALTWYPGAAAIAKQPKPVQIAEGFANLVEHLATGQPVNRLALNWFNNDYKQTHGDTYSKIESVIKNTQDYIAQTPQQLGIAFISPEKQTLKQRIGTAISNILNRDRILTNYKDYATRIRDVDRAAGTQVGDMANIAAFAPRNMAHNWVHVRQTAPDNTILKDYGLSKHFDGLSSDDFLAVESYMVANQVIHGYIEKGLTPGMSRADAEAIINSAPSWVIQKAGKFWSEYADLLNSMRSISTMTDVYISKLFKNNRAATGTDHGFYLPMHRVGKSGTDSSRRRVGSVRGVDHPLNKVEAALSDMLKQAYNLQILEEMSIAYLNNPGNPFISKNIRVINNADTIKALETHYRNKVQEASGTELTPTQLDDTVQMMAGLVGLQDLPTSIMPAEGYSIIAAPNPNIDSKNKVIFLEVADDYLRGFVPTTGPIINHPLMKYMFTVPKVTMQTAATTLRASFQLATNIPRDLLTSWRRSPVGLFDIGDVAATRLAGYRDMLLFNTGVDKKLGRRSYAHVAEDLGLLYSTMHNKELYDAQLRNRGYDVIDLTASTGNTLIQAFNKFTALLGTGEQGTRLGAMISYLRSIGKSPGDPLTTQERIDASKAFLYASTNYLVTGRHIDVLNRIVPFARATAATINQSIDDLRGVRGPVVQKKAIALVLGSAIAGAAAQLEYGDEDWFREMPIALRSKFNFMPINLNGSNYLVRVALDDVASFGYSLGQAAVQDRSGSEWDDSLLDWASVITSNLSPVDVNLTSPQGAFESASALTGVIGKHAIEQALNKNFYFQSPIEPPEMKYTHPKITERYYPYTTEVAKWLGNKLGWSPIRIEAALSNFAPGPMDFLKGVEKQLDPTTIKDQNRTGVIDSIVNLWLHSQQQEEINFKSSDIFYNTLKQLSANTLYETPEEKQLRLSLTDIQKSLTNTRLILQYDKSLTQADKQKIYLERRQLFKEARDRIEGDVSRRFRERYKIQGKRYRKQRRDEAVERYQQNLTQ